ncbi:hypothetical protein FIBSPDRAFT_856588 [Athelia psychrophila]|uniref:Uncharacterized protein n=1 Tax=Athelia psychrophila TaxID=1759441 RepID=A0A167TRL6_9AGAM|nr:hypothetical protein FIBSPDRAFT_879663 [Fibularhizoctonia sp. CBS 109695]KZP24804.1 hypothetical protein FIBSPDRAFT_856588 [Fibularhizoctonia sp. CBS 109695]
MAIYHVRKSIAVTISMGRRAMRSKDGGKPYHKDIKTTPEQQTILAPPAVTRF